MVVSTAYELATAYDLSRKELVFCDVDESVREVARRFLEKGIGSMIVRSPEGYVGFVTDDVLFRAIADGVDLRTATCGDLELDPLHTIQKDAHLSEVADAFRKTRATRLAVVDKNGKIVAVVKRKNLELLDRFTFVRRMLYRDRRV